MERDALRGVGLDAKPDFNPRAPHGARLRQVRGEEKIPYFNPRAPHGARHVERLMEELNIEISIHALRMERDVSLSWYAQSLPFQSTRSAWSATDWIPRAQGDHQISIHALRMERDRLPPIISATRARFQSTRSAWSATHSNDDKQAKQQYFNPRAPHGARRQERAGTDAPKSISIHALRMERDNYDDCVVHSLAYFNPRAPHGARRDDHRPHRRGEGISIHALRMERDVRYHKLPAASKPFQSTRSAWSATFVGFSNLKKINISIHALRMERDPGCGQPPEGQDFNPRAPHGARL